MVGAPSSSFRVCSLKKITFEIVISPSTLPSTYKMWNNETKLAKSQVTCTCDVTNKKCMNTMSTNHPIIAKLKKTPKTFLSYLIAPNCANSLL